jgi:hypothetical protein
VKERNENVKFSMLHMPCCGTLLCHVNPRMPNYCPECGTRFPGGLRRIHPQAILFTDDNAWLKYNDPEE